jgi:thioredoxin-dependent peroxiredoxin
MTERQAATTLHGNPFTLLGEQLKVGDKAPDFSLKAVDMSDKSLADFAGKVKIVTIVPSIDTPVCDTEVRKFNEQAGKLDGVSVLVVSVDTPFAQKRWCGAAGVENVHMLSDYKDQAFGPAYGVRIKELGLLARTVLVVDRDNVIRYAEHVKEVSAEPDYNAALVAAKALV